MSLERAECLLACVMSNESDEPQNDGPPPPSIKEPTPPPSPPSVPDPPASESSDPAPPIKVKVKSGSDDGAGSSGPPIPIGTRVLATVIDFSIAAGLFYAVVIVSNLPLLGFLSALAGPVLAAFILTRDGLPFLNGQSPGKSAMKLRAVTLDGKSLSGNWQPALIRNAVLLIPIFGLVELVVLLTREDKPDRGIRLGDEWAKTRVVWAEPPAAMDTSTETEKSDA